MTGYLTSILTAGRCAWVLAGDFRSRCGMTRPCPYHEGR